MKKLLIIVVMIGIILPAFAAPSDIVITLTIPAAKVADFKEAFLREHPVPMEAVLDEEGNRTGETQPRYTDKQWIKMRIKSYVMGEYREGKRKLSNDAAVIDEDIIQ